MDTEKRILTRRIFLKTTGIAAMGLTLAGCRKKEAEDANKYTIGYSQFWGTSPFLIAMTNGAKKAAEEWNAKGVGVELIVTNGGDMDASRQVADCEDLFAQSVDGLLIFPGDSTLLSEPVKNLYNKNDIPVVITDIGLESGKSVSFIITDNYLGGKIAAELLVKNLPKGAKVITFQHAPGNANARERQKGFEDTAAKLGFQVLPEKLCKLSLEDGKRLMEDTLTSIHDIACVFFINQIVAEGAASALESAGNKTTKLVSFDIDATSLQMVKEGKILGLVVQDPYLMGYEGMNQMLTYLTGGTPKPQIDIAPKLCTMDNASEFDNDSQVQQ